MSQCYQCKGYYSCFCVTRGIHGSGVVEFSRASALYYEKLSKVSHTTTTKVTTEETTSSTTTTTEEATTTTEIKTTTSTTTSNLKDVSKAEQSSKSEQPDNGIQQKLEDLRPDLKPLVENNVLQLDVPINQDVTSTFLNSDPTVLLIGKDKSECSNLVLIFHQLKFRFEENYDNLDKLPSKNVPAIIFCSYGAYFNVKKSDNFKRFEQTPILLFPYFTESAQFSIQNAELEVKHIVKNATYQFKIAESKFNRVAKASQVIHYFY